MNRMNRAGLAGVVGLVLTASGCSAASLAGGSGAVRVGHWPAADAVPTTTTPGAVVTPTTALPNLPTVPTVAPAPTVALPPTIAPAPTIAPVPVTAAGPWIALTDDTGMLTVEVPTTWTDYDTRPFINEDNTLRPGITASTDLVAFDEEWSTPGVVYTAFHFQPDPNILFAKYDYTNACTDGGYTAYNDGVFTGYQRTFTDCSDVRSQNYVIVANAPGNLVTVVLVIQTVTPADQPAYQHVLDTFNVDPNVPMPTETVPPTTSVPAPTAPTVPIPTVPLPTVAPAPTAPPLPTSTVLTTPTVAPGPVPTAPLPTTPGTSAIGVPAGYQSITDQTGRLTIQVPSTWIDIDGASAMEEGVLIAAMSAAPSLQTFRETFNGPGVLIHETPFKADPVAELARRAMTGCTPAVVTANPNPAFSGVYQSFLDCAGTTADLHVLVANPLDGRQTTIVIVFQTLTPADEEALKVAFSSYALNTVA